MNNNFGFKDLIVWQKSMTFIDLVLDEVDQLNSDRKHYRLVEQIESAVTSVAMNIAEGKGRNSKKEFIHFLYISRGSLYETSMIKT
ncbi:MAG: four helix bundle protein [Bacteroidales bacterium]|nr:four helix bundle protein [Bacteroidales bacterium]